MAIHILKLNSQFWQEQAREPLLGGVSRFILSRTLKVAALGKVSPSVNVQLVTLSFLTAPDAWHPCLSLFWSPLLASTPKTVKVSPHIFLFPPFLKKIFLNPGKAQVWSSSSEKDLCALDSVQPHLPAEISDFSVRAPLFFTSFIFFAPFTHFFAALKKEKEGAE